MHGFKPVKRVQPVNNAKHTRTGCNQDRFVITTIPLSSSALLLL